MSGDLSSIAACAAATAALAATGPLVLRRLPEPVEEPAASAASPAGAAAAAGEAGTQKIPYARLAERRRLALWLAAVGLVVGGVVGARLGFEPIVWAWIYLGGVGVVLADIDWQTRLLPTKLIAPSYLVLAALVVLAGVVDDDWHAVLRAGYGGLATFAFFYVMWFIYPRGMGFGDVRLSGLLGLALGYVGWGPVFVGMYAGFLLGGLGGALLTALRLFHRKRFPFGPFMLVGALVGLVTGLSFADWYTGF